MILQAFTSYPKNFEQGQEMLHDFKWSKKIQEDPSFFLSYDMFNDYFEVLFI